MVLTVDDTSTVRVSVSGVVDRSLAEVIRILYTQIPSETNTQILFHLIQYIFSQP